MCPHPSERTGSIENVHQRSTDGWQLLDSVVPRKDPPTSKLGWWKQRTLRKALESFNQALALEKDYKQAQWGRGRVLSLQGHLPDAFSELCAASTNHQGDIHLLRDTAIVALQLGEGEHAEQYIRAMIDRGKDDGDTLRLYALALLINGQNRRALGVITNAWKRASDQANIWNTLVYVKGVVKGEIPAPTRIEL